MSEYYYKKYIFFEFLTGLRCVSFCKYAKTINAREKLANISMHSTTSRAFSFIYIIRSPSPIKSISMFYLIIYHEECFLVAETFYVHVSVP